MMIQAAQTRMDSSNGMQAYLAITGFRGGLYNNFHYRSWLRDIHRVAGFRLANCCAGPFGHVMLGGRRNHLVFGSDQIPARLGSPSWNTYRTSKGFHIPTQLRVRHELRVLDIYVGGKRRSEIGFVQQQEAILRRKDWRCS